MEDNATRKKIGRSWYKPPKDNKTSGKPFSKPNKPQDSAPLKFYKCASTSHLASACSKKMRINEIEIERAEDTKEKDDLALHESDYEPSK
ncbi:hypothetical protein O181_046888 [Austropuccinia psidii MF-1]|uniref:Uncharacterized protein n=1 Tax=Austropuccinia psidii MF-1 TaxID=1389203 RepID=A0A9Q3HIZ8_9BASI|nr:hypothetical protein [Austropuccinia psidii MF-1]